MHRQRPNHIKLEPNKYYYRNSAKLEEVMTEFLYVLHGMQYRTVVIAPYHTLGTVFFAFCFYKKTNKLYMLLIESEDNTTRNMMVTRVNRITEQAKAFHSAYSHVLESYQKDDYPVIGKPFNTHTVFDTIT